MRRVAISEAPDELEVHAISADNRHTDLDRICNLLDRQHFVASRPNRCLIMTSGVGEDSISLRLNGLIDSADALLPDTNGFFALLQTIHDETVGSDCGAAVSYEEELQVISMAHAFGLSLCEIALPAHRRFATQQN